MLGEERLHSLRLTTPWNQVRNSQAINQFISLTTNPSINRTINQITTPWNQVRFSQSINQSIKQPINQSIHPSIHQSINQYISLSTTPWDQVRNSVPYNQSNQSINSPHPGIRFNQSTHSNIVPTPYQPTTYFNLLILTPLLLS